MSEKMQTLYLSPAVAVQEAKRLVRGRRTYIHATGNVHTDDDKVFPVGGCVRVAKAEFLELVGELAGFANRKRERGYEGSLSIKISVYHDSLFV